MPKAVVKSLRSNKPVMFDVMNGFYWEGQNKLFTQVGVDLPRLPNNVNLVGRRIERDTLPSAKGVV
ncbi:MAG TPA: hypothetical protein VFG19_06330 [Geobacteraceae bacterium]|nr:hypothetical protein [Geobacteraceae bacterium]